MEREKSQVPSPDVVWLFFYFFIADILPIVLVENLLALEVELAFFYGDGAVVGHRAMRAVGLSGLSGEAVCLSGRARLASYAENAPHHIQQDDEANKHYAQEYEK